MGYFATKKMRQKSGSHQSGSFNFRYSAIALALAGVMLAPNVIYAADDKAFAELQAENARLRQELEASKNVGATPQAVLPVDQTASTPTPTPSTTAASSGEKGNPIALDAVVIHSKKRIELKQDVPQSISVVTGTELQSLNANDVTAIVKRAGDVSWNQGNQRTSSLSIRGVGKIGQLEAMDPSLLLTVDGVSYAFNPITSSFNFVDIDSVEVTRGPQGTDGGKNSPLGKITINTRRPSFTPSADYAITIGQRDTLIGEYSAGGPIKEDLLAYRLNFTAQKGEGYLTNTNNQSTDRTYMGDTNRISGKAQFLLTPSDAFSARFEVDRTPTAGEYTNNNTLNKLTPTTYANGAPTSVLTDPAASVAANKDTTSATNDIRVNRSWFQQQYPSYYAQTQSGGGYYANTLNIDGGYPVLSGSNGGTLDLTWNLSDFIVNSTTAYKEYHFDAKNDDGTPYAISTTGGVNDDYKQYSQELSLSNKPGSFVDYKTGIYAIKEQVDYTSFTNYLQDAGAWNATPWAYSTLTNPANITSNGLLTDGALILQSAQNGVMREVVNNILNKSVAVYGQAKWHLSEPLTLTTGLRITREDRQNPSSNLVTNQGTLNANWLNPVSVNGVQLGGFSSNAFTGNLNAGNSAAQLAIADAVANEYFGKTYSQLNSQQKAIIAAAKSVRNNAISSTLFNMTNPQGFVKNQPTILLSPTYKFSENLTSYISYQHGEKAGVPQIVKGESVLALPEKTNAYEIGVKSSLLNKTLILNYDLYQMDITDYQQSVTVIDPLNSSGTISYTGNAPKVRSRGLEVDGVYSGITHTNIRFSGAIIDARYMDFKNAPQAAENANISTPANLTGQQLPGASRYTFNFGVDYHIPVSAETEAHFNSNTTFTSSYNSDTSLSSYATIPNAWTTDLGIGVGKINKSFDVTLIVKNAFQSEAPQAQTWNSITPAIPRWMGLKLSGKL